MSYRIDWTQGSSPLTRGKRELRQLQARNRGLIPAHAGKTAANASPYGCTGAHPRSRGENPCRADRPFLALGSSPLTRGKQFETRQYKFGPRLIPAHAGKT